jgi:hypothetical protein
MLGIPLKRFAVIVGFDQSGNGQMIEHTAHVNKKIALVETQHGRFVVMQSVKVTDGSKVHTEFNLANVIALEIEPLEVVEAAPVVEGGGEPAPLPEPPVQQQ